MIKTTTVNTILTIMIVLALLLCALAFGTACSGDDDTACMNVENCPDAGNPTTADADTLSPDADTTPDANSDPCAEYEWLNGTTWDCSGGAGYHCAMTVFYYEEAQDCIIRCEGAFSATPDLFQVSADHQNITEPAQCFRIN